jgi:hypothetical protein
VANDRLMPVHEQREATDEEREETPERLREEEPERDERTVDTEEPEEPIHDA